MKKSLLTRILCIAMVLAFAVLAVACGETEQEVSDTSSGSTTSQTVSEEEKFVLFSNLPEKNYGGKEFVVLVEGDYMNTYRSIELVPQAESYSGLNTAIQTRNDLISEKFGVEIVEERTAADGEMLATLRENAMAGVSIYDMVMPYMSNAATLALEGSLYDLNELEHIHLDQKYYDQGSVADLSVAGKNYFVTGDLSLLSFACTHAIIFNKDMVKENGMEDPYKLVEDGKWTLDKLLEMSSKVTGDTDGESGMSYTDTYGFLVNDNFILSMYIAAGQRLTTKDNKDEPVIAITGEGPARVYEKIYDIVTNVSATCQFSAAGNSYYTSATAAGKNIWVAAIESIANKKALFRAMALIDIFDHGDYDCNFGVLPTPKYDEAQENYYSRVSTVYSTSVAIPFNVADPEMSAIITDALMQASTDTTKNAYFQVIMKERKVQDTESEKMLDIIFNSRVYDLGSIYHWGGTNEADINSISGFMNVVATSGSNTFASSWQSIESAVQAKMDETISAYLD